MTIIDVLEHYPTVFFSLAGLVGLLVGSFLNVVIYRLPVMLQNAWNSNASDQLGIGTAESTPFNLMTPNSRCTCCGHAIRPWENIPVVSWIFLRGRCSACKKPISIRYPAVELTTAILSAGAAMHFGYSMGALFSLLLIWSSIVLFMIDVDEMLLPDVIVVPGIWLGLFANCFGVFTTPVNSVIGAIAGYLLFAVPVFIFALVTRRQGMGSGDFKLVALFGAFGGWQVLPLILLFSTVACSVVGLLARIRRSEPFPFGPFIVVAGLLSLFYSHEIYDAYAQWSGIAIGAGFFG